MLLNCGVGGDSWDSLGLQGHQPIHPKGNQSWIFIGRTDTETEPPLLWPPDVMDWLIGKDPDAGKDWRQEEKGTTEDEMVGWHHWLDGPLLAEQCLCFLICCLYLCIYIYTKYYSVQFSSVAQSCPTLFDPMDCSTPGLPVYHQLPEFTQTHVHWVGDTIQPSHPLSSPSPPALNLSHHQGLLQWVSSSRQVAKVLEFHLQHQSFQWTPRTDLI